MKNVSYHVMYEVCRTQCLRIGNQSHRWSAASLVDTILALLYPALSRGNVNPPHIFKKKKKKKKKLRGHNQITHAGEIIHI